MAATVEGVFRIIDRASPKMRDMERQAIKTDAAITALGAKLDTLGGPKQLKSLDNLDRRLRTVGLTTEKVTKDVARSTKAMDQHTRSVQKSDSMWKRLSGTLGLVFKDLTSAPVKFLALGTAVGVAGQAIGALSGGVLGLASQLGRLSAPLAAALPAVAGLGLAAVTARLAFHNLSQAMAGNLQAIRSLTPEGAKLMRAMFAFRPIMREFRRSAQGGLFSGITDAMKNIRTAAPTVNRVLQNMSAQEGQLVRQAGRRFTQGGVLRDVQAVAGTGTALVGNAGRGLMNIADALRHVAVAAQPLARWIGAIVEGWTKYIDRSARAGRESGRLAAFFDRARTSLTQVGHIIRNVWQGVQSLLKAATPLGDLLFRDAERGTKAWAKMLGTTREQASLTQRFVSMEPAIRAMFHLVGELARLIFNMGANNNLATTVNSLTKALPPIAKALTTIANNFGPPFAKAIGQVATLVQDLTAGSGPLVKFVTGIGNLAGFLDRIANASPVVKGLFSYVFSVLVIGRYLTKLGLLEKGWWNIFRAVSATAAVERTMGVPGVPLPGGRGRTPGGVIPVGGGGGIRGFFRKIFRRGGAAEEVPRFPVSSQLPGMRGASVVGDAAKVAEAGGLLSKLGPLGRLAGLGRLGGVAGAGLGIASKAFLPLTGVLAAFGALSAGRSGSIGHQIGQTAYGALQGATGGLLGGGLGLLGFHHVLETPSARAQRNVSAIDKRVQEQMSGANRIPGQMARLQAQLRILDAAAGDISDRQQQASKDYIDSLKQQTQAIKDQIAQMKQVQRERGRAKGTEYARQIDIIANRRMRTMGPVAGFKAGETMVLQRLNALPNTEAGRAQALMLGRGLIRNAVENARKDPRLAAEVPAMRLAVPAILKQKFGITLRPSAGKATVTGSRQERLNLAGRLANPVQEQLYGAKKAPTPVQQQLIDSMIAAGATPRAAQDYVLSMEEPGGRLYMAYKGGLPPKATGGRLGGKGMFDTVPVPGGRAAPGELVVNRHTEHRVNAQLRGRTLGQMVAGENKRHSDGFAKGGRTGGFTVGPGSEEWGPIDVKDVNKILIADVRRLGADYSVQVNSGFRTHKHQAALYQQYVDSGFSQAHIAAKPYASAHEYGLAVDANVGGSAAGNALTNAQLARYGLVAPVGGDPVHLEMLNDSPQLLGLSRALALAGKNPKAGMFAGIAGAAGAAGAGVASAATMAAAAAARRQALSFNLPTALREQANQMDALTGLPGFTTIPTAPKAKKVAGGAAAGGAAAVGGTGVSLGVAAAGVAQKYAKSQLRRYGWGMDQFPSLVTLWNGESGWDPTAMNSDTRAQGIPQLNPAAHTVPPGFPDVPPINAAAQVDWGLNYIKHGSRFNSPSTALAFWNSNSPHWYAKGGRIPQFAGWNAVGMKGTFDSPTLVGVGEKGREHVTVTPAGKTGGGGGVTVNNTFNITGGEPGQVQREVEMALRAFTTHLEHSDLAVPV